MTDQERQLVQELIERVRRAPPPQVDREADALIRQGLSGRTDALYIMVQSVLLQQMALDEANARIQELQRGGSQESFLGGGYGGSQYAQSQPAYQQPQYEQPRSGFSNFLHNAAQTAAGIVAGEVAFSALSSLFGHHESYSRGYEMPSGFLGGGGGETVVNNYYEGASGHDSGLSPGLSPDLEDRRFDNGRDSLFGGSSDTTDTADDSSDSADYSGDESSGFDDSSDG